MPSNFIPETGYMRLSQILGNKKAGIPAIIPISKTSWWQKCKTYPTWPKPVRLGRCTFWKASDIRDLIQRLENGGE
jgi:predicted DNA-binding transcriptional regulator AlpA